MASNSSRLPLRLLQTNEHVKCIFAHTYTLDESRRKKKNMLFENANNCSAVKNAQIDRDFVVRCPDKIIYFILARAKHNN